MICVKNVFPIAATNVKADGSDFESQFISKFQNETFLLP